MKRFAEQIRGTVRVELCGTLPEAALNACAINGVMLWDIECADEYTVRASVYEKQLEELKAIAQKTMCEIAVISMRGGSRSRRKIARRLWLIISAAVIAGLLCLSSLFIWEIDVRGCSRLTQGQVLRALADCGVESGSFWPSISADLVRSQMMTKLPELGWMTVNISGSRAIVLVSERQEKPEIFNESEASDIIAGKTGIISRVSVQSGKALISEGQAVMKGETLISGTVDSLSNPPRFVHARAQIMADTWYELCSACPLELDIKTEETSKKSRFALKIGRNRINFYFGSGNDIDGCDKIINEYRLGAEGLFALPISIVREDYVRWEYETGKAADEQAMKQQLYEYLESSIDGEIVDHSFSVSRSDGVLYVILRAHCLENIAVNSEIQYGGETTLPTAKGNG